MTKQSGYLIPTFFCHVNCIFTFWKFVDVHRLRQAVLNAAPPQIRDPLKLIRHP